VPQGNAKLSEKARSEIAMTQQASKSVPCPRCGKLAPFSTENPWRPFCSERCKLIDLGNWATESYRLPNEAAPEGDDEPGKA
jgi:endogenous inhibitor of DNA gyrase (YacG/DUF329 family)